MHSIQQVAALTGITSRTLRHYDAVGLLPPAEVGPGGVRHYDDAALLRLQQVLVLRELGMPLAEIRAALAGEQVPALRRHLAQLQAEHDRLGRMARTVAQTIKTLEEGGELVPDEMFDGFDHTRYRAEVEERWGEAAYATGDKWWRAMSDAERRDWLAQVARLNADWTAAAEAGVAADSEAAQAPATRHAAWLASIPGTPRSGAGPAPEYLRSLGEMYVADPRFAANYGGEAGARLVRDALAVYVERRG